MCVFNLYYAVLRDGIEMVDLSAHDDFLVFSFPVPIPTFPLEQSNTALLAENNPNPFGTPSLDLGGSYVGGWTPPAQQSSFGASNAGPPPFGAAAAPAASASDPYADNPYAAAVLGNQAAPSPAPFASSGGWKPAPIGPKPPLKVNPNHPFDHMRFVAAAAPRGW